MTKPLSFISQSSTSHPLSRRTSKTQKTRRGKRKGRGGVWKGSVKGARSRPRRNKRERAPDSQSQPRTQTHPRRRSQRATRAFFTRAGSQLVLMAGTHVRNALLLGPCLGGGVCYENRWRCSLFFLPLCFGVVVLCCTMLSCASVWSKMFQH